MNAVVAPSAGAAQLGPVAQTQNRYKEGLKQAGIEPHSSNPSGTKPYAVCPPPTKQRFSCLSAAVPEGLASQRKASLAGPRLEGSGQRGGFSPADLRAAYNLPAEGGAGLTIAITIAYDYPTAESDLAVYRETYGLPPCTSANGCFEKVNQQGKPENYPEARSGWAAEAALDLDMASAICSECKLLLVEADDNTRENLPAAVDTAAELGADVISDSWGGGEFSEEALLDPYLDHPGVPVLFASGDWGYEVSYPAASPDVIAVGGTSLRKGESARGWSESAWVGAGSGCSAYEEKPAWQTDEGCAKRSVADVAAVADPKTPVSVYDTYGAEYEGWLLFGGTSVSAPLLAGVEALSSGAERAAGAELFWQQGSEGRLFDVGEGRNGICSPEAEYLCLARLGYDGPTGWGTPGGSRPGPPDVATYDASTVSASSATLNGAVNPNGEGTTYRFEYGSTTSYGASVPTLGGNAGPGTNPVEVEQDLTGLIRDATYHYRLVASNGLGTTYGGDHTFVTSPWTVQYMPRIQEQREEMHGVSCVSPTACVAVGSQGVYYEPPSYYYNNAPLVERWDGSQWTRETVPVYHPPADGYASRLNDVSCSSSDFCMAVGENYEARVGFGLIVERWDGEQWSLVPAPAPSEEVRPHGVSCVSPTFCVLIGEVANSRGSYHIKTLVEMWDGSQWTVQPSPNPPERDQNRLWSVSCASTTWCVAVGASDNYNGGGSGALIEVWDGAKWSVESSPTLTGSFLEGVSCSSSSACMAVGSTGSERWDGNEWLIEPTGKPMQGVSCIAASWCVGVGMVGSIYEREAIAEHWNGSKWTAENPVHPSDASDEQMQMEDVSCVSSGCTAVGWYWSWGYQPLAERLRRSAPVAIEKPASPNGLEATLHGTVNAEGLETTYQFEYDTTEYKEGEGPHGTTVPVEPEGIGAGYGDVQVDQLIRGLAVGTTYHFRVVASNSGGIARSPEGTFTPADPPAAINDPPGSITQTTAVLNGHIDNEGAEGGSTCKFVVALASAPGTPVTEPACSPNPVTGDASTPVQATATGLDPNTEYVYRLVAESIGGTATGASDGTFQTLPNAPAVLNDPPGSITQTTAVLTGRVDNEGAEGGSTCKFVVALESAPATPIAEPACDPNPVSGDTNTSVEATASGLSANTNYVYRVVATNSSGTSIGAPDQEFATLPEPPLVSNDPAGSITQTTAVLNGHVDNEGAAAGSTCKFVLALRSSPSTPVAEPACEPDTVTGNASVAVQATVGSLQPNTPYVHRVIAANAGGTSTGTPDQSLRTLPNAPAVLNDPPGSITQTTAVLTGRVDNEGAAAGSTCKFVLALRSSPSTPVAEPACEPNSISGDTSTAVEATAGSLSPNSRYVYRVIATNTGGTSTGSPDQEFTTLPNPPGVANDAASSVTQSTAVLRGYVDNEGAEAGSSCKFVVALEASPQIAVEEPSCQPNPVTGDTSTPVEATATELAPNTKYVYRIAASNAGGSTSSAPGARFATLPNVPAVANDPASSITQTTAVVRGHVDNEGAAKGSSCTFIVALRSAPRSPLAEADCVANPVTGASVVAVEATVDGLSANTRYVYRVTAENEGGKSTAVPDQEFRTLASNAFGIWQAEVRCDGRIVLWLEAPGSGRFRARATMIAAPHRALKGAPGSRGRQSGCGGLLHRAHEPAHRHSQAHAPPSLLFYGAGSVTARAAGSARLTIQPRRSALEALSRNGRLRVHIALTFYPDGGVPRTKHVTMIVRRPPRHLTRTGPVSSSDAPVGGLAVPLGRLLARWPG